ncbi:MAG: hypothetical protein WBC61_03620 [Dehalococcoidia bacterium]
MNYAVLDYPCELKTRYLTSDKKHTCFKGLKGLNLIQRYWELYHL